MVRPSQLSFDTLVTFFDHVKGLKGKKDVRRKQLATFINSNLENNSDELFDFWRLLLPQVSFTRLICAAKPQEKSRSNTAGAHVTRIVALCLQLDNERRNYGLKEATFVKVPCLCENPSCANLLPTQDDRYVKYLMIPDLMTRLHRSSMMHAPRIRRSISLRRELSTSKSRANLLM